MDSQSIINQEDGGATHEIRFAGDCVIRCGRDEETPGAQWINTMLKENGKADDRKINVSWTNRKGRQVATHVTKPVKKNDEGYVRYSRDPSCNAHAMGWSPRKLWCELTPRVKRVVVIGPLGLEQTLTYRMERTLTHEIVPLHRVDEYLATQTTQGYTLSFTPYVDWLPRPFDYDDVKGGHIVIWSPCDRDWRFRKSIKKRAMQGALEVTNVESRKVNFDEEELFSPAYHHLYCLDPTELMASTAVVRHDGVAAVDDDDDRLGLPRSSSPPSISSPSILSTTISLTRDSAFW